MPPFDGYGGRLGRVTHSEVGGLHGDGRHSQPAGRAAIAAHCPGAFLAPCRTRRAKQLANTTRRENQGSKLQTKGAQALGNKGASIPPHGRIGNRRLGRARRGAGGPAFF
ncbi:hypothetical protein DQ04_14671000 [Trypanosoma grayi]|uniref:hypothetical protein n=1 Tax=Trypanosoma grayi TaxID=71804 RepID=UPI0004F42C17|nr:hypothetical protein DQ04_14671000 [Trypanosoma grayi]KEG06311.1 hypothetical protein DQ04_14671000 [Trypanosoma grayi]